MRPIIDETHDPALTSWVTSARDHKDFPIQNLPLGVFAPADGHPRGGIAIGDSILDLAALATSGLLDEGAQIAATAAAGSGKQPITLPTGETRTFLEDGDELELTGRMEAEGFVSIGFGSCRGIVAPAVAA